MTAHHAGQGTFAGHRSTRFVVAAFLAAALVAGCSDDSEDPPAATPETVTVTETAPDDSEAEEAEPGDDEPGSETPESGSGDGGTVSRAEAKAAALDAVGDGRATWSGREDDHGAAWEIEITRPDGSEVDVLVAADGSIVRIER